MRKRELVKQVVRAERESTIGAVLFHQAVGEVLGVNVTDMKCLDIMSLRSSASPSQLAALTGLSTGSTTAMLDRLEKRRLIARRPNPRDRRGRTVVLTAYAMKTLPALFQSLAAAKEALAARYTEGELRIVADFLAKATVVWNDERERVRSVSGKRRRR